MSGPAFTLNPDLDIDRYAAVYREQGLVQIPDIFTPETARAVRDLLAGAMPWRLLFTDENDGPVHYTGVDWNGLPQADRTRMMQDVHARVLAALQAWWAERVGE